MSDSPVILDTPSRGTLGRLERGKATRRNLGKTAARLWSERGFEAVTVEEICSAAGVGRTTFYLHFESKEDLLSSLAEATGAGVAADLGAVDPLASLEEHLEVFIGGVVRRMEGVPRSLVELVIHSQHVTLLRAPTRANEQAWPRFSELLGHVLEDAQARGELVPSADTAELGEMLGALTMDAIEAWSSGRSRGRSLQSVLRFRFGVVIDACRARRP